MTTIVKCKVTIVMRIVTIVTYSNHGDGYGNDSKV